MKYKGYELYVHPELSQFGCRICFIKQSGLTLFKVLGLTEDEAIETAKRLINHKLGEDNSETISI